MIELNLLPEELKGKKGKRIGASDIPVIPIAVGITALMVAIQISIVSFISLSKGQLETLEKTWSGLAPKKKEFAEIKERISSIQKKIKAIEGLIEKRLSLAGILNELSDSMTASIWLSELSFDEKKVADGGFLSRKTKGKKGAPGSASENHIIRTLSITGSAAGTGDEATSYVARLIKSLKDNRNFFKHFDDVELVSITKGSTAGAAVMNFKLVCRFKPEKESQ